MKDKIRWSAPGFGDVMAHTKGEARAFFKVQLQSLEKLSFHPRKILRLPIGTQIVRK